MPAQSNHPVFEAPVEPNVKVWRYMDFTKFISILETNGLFFSRADLLGDPYEGSTSHFNKTAWPEVYKGKIPLASLHAASGHNKWQREWTFVNCWHMNEFESAAMWSLYAKTNQAVAIQSTYALLHAGLPNYVYVGTVKYIDYKSEWLPEGNIFYPFVHKRREFAHERELRAVWSDLPKTLDPNSKDTIYDIRPNSNSGRNVCIDIPAVVQNVYVAPTSPAWFRELVVNVIARYKLSIPVAPSAIDEPPTF